MKKYILFAGLGILVAGCPWIIDYYEYDTGKFPSTPVNIEDINSIYDDYNATAPNILHQQLFHFSSNRNSAGGDFDIVGEDFVVDWDKVNGTLEVGNPHDILKVPPEWFDERFAYLEPMFDSINTPSDEFGPYSLGYRQENANYEVTWTDLLLYASDESGQFDINFIYGQLFNGYDTTTNLIVSPEPVRFLNSEANDLYPSFYGEAFYYYDEWGQDPADVEKIFFCSDREGNYDIYEVELPRDSSLFQILRSEGPYPTLPWEFNSDADDKCPFANGKLLVFTSDREGGYGGFDLYYSVHRDDGWSEPRNFGEKINTSYDEYRPITINYHDFENTLMIFSSDRPGGKGGFDLYYVGINQGVE